MGRLSGGTQKEIDKNGENYEGRVFYRPLALSGAMICSGTLGSHLSLEPEQATENMY